MVHPAGFDHAAGGVREHFAKQKRKATIKQNFACNNTRNVKNKKINRKFIYEVDFCIFHKFCLIGTPGGIRTHGLLLRRQTLYPTELRVHLVYNITHFCVL